jgi:hypothetical protein
LFWFLYFFFGVLGSDDISPFSSLFLITLVVTSGVFYRHLYLIESYHIFAGVGVYLFLNFFGMYILLGVILLAED